MKSICVFCGSGGAGSELYMNSARNIGKLLAESGIRVIYGGARLGLMGALADGVLAAGGEVVGVMPEFLMTKEVVHEDLTELVHVDTMHERKIKMHELSDGVITLPGGWGTMEEMFEMLTWGQLGLHKKPMGLLNVNGYYNCLISLMDNMVQEGFLKDYFKGYLKVHEEPEALLQLMTSYEPISMPQWINEKTS